MSRASRSAASTTSFVLYTHDQIACSTGTGPSSAACCNTAQRVATHRRALPSFRAQCATADGLCRAAPQGLMVVSSSGVLRHRLRYSSCTVSGECQQHCRVSPPAHAIKSSQAHPKPSPRCAQFEAPKESLQRERAAQADGEADLQVAPPQHRQRKPREPPALCRLGTGRR